MIPDRAGNADNWELDKLVVILLRQFKRLLDQHSVELSNSDMERIGQAVTQRAESDAQARAAAAALLDIIAESENVLAGWNLTFAESLRTDMNALGGWESTADFLQLANEKVNAEVRISAGSALALLLGERRHAPHLLAAIEHDLETLGHLDVDAVIARRALLHAAQIPPEAPDWLARAHDWAAQ
jgi:hypothetical protein